MSSQTLTLIRSHTAPPARFRPPFHADHLPVDILPPILSHLNDRKDWHTCTLVSKTFCRVATPFLYNTLDSRVISKTWVHHPCTTLLARPELARYVRRVTETGAVHRGMHIRYPNITKDALAALALCTNLRSMTWIDDVSSRTSTSTKILAFLDVIRTLPVRELTIRTHTDLGEEVWSQLITLTGLHKVSIWCMEGPPRVLQGWSGPLGSTLTHLELGRCAGVPPTILITVLMQLPLLEDLRLKGAPATAIPTILTFLPNLQILDTEYLLSGSGTYYTNPRPRPQPRPARQRTRTRTRSLLENLNTHSPGDQDGKDNDHTKDLENEDDLSDSSSSSSSSSPTDTSPPDPPFPTLHKLTVRTSSMDNLGPQKLWPWIRELTPLPGLQSFRLHAFTFHSMFLGSTSGPIFQVPRMFILDMASTHGASLREFDVGEASLTLGDVECLCTKFERLEVLVCALACVDVASIVEAISPAKNLHTLKLQVTWIPTLSGSSSESSSDSDNEHLPHPHYPSLSHPHTQAHSRMMTPTRFLTSIKTKTTASHLVTPAYTKAKFTLEDATRMMMGEDSDPESTKLRVISVGGVLYTGKWVLEADLLKFVVSADVAEDKWKT